MKVEILKSDKRLGVKKGEMYKARPYSLDPGAKVELISRIPDGYDPMCSQYRNEVKIV